jgi:hypothetical protein
MKEKTRYTDEPIQLGRVLPNFLPPPAQLVFKEDAVKVTITLSSRSVLFFKAEAAKRGVQYQRMIRRLLDAYVEAFEPAGRGSASREAKGDRVEQARGAYRKVAKRRK